MTDFRNVVIISTSTVWPGSKLQGMVYSSFRPPTKYLKKNLPILGLSLYLEISSLAEGISSLEEGSSAMMSYRDFFSSVALFRDNERRFTG